MNKFLTMTFLFFSTTSYAMMVGSGNNMGAEQAPKSDRSTNSSMTDTDRRTNTYPISTYGEDSISTGQSATKRSTSRTCVDSSGFAYYKNDSGYAACVNQSTNHKK